MFEKMLVDEVVDIFDEIKEERVEEFLNSMEKEVLEEVKEFMEYFENSVGVIMIIDFILFKIYFIVE